jgi:putative ABC transport system permease protein
MIRNYLKAALRNIIKNKVFFLINVLGLAVGMAGCLLIAQYVLHELSYDQAHERKDRIFRVELDRYDKGELSTQWAAGAVGIGPELKANFPEIERYVRMHGESAVLDNGDVFFKEDRLYYAGEDFFRIFSIPLIEGVDSTVLKAPYTMALSARLAKKYFGNQDPIGKSLKMNAGNQFEITGVFEDLPGNTHMRFDALISFATYESYIKDKDNLNKYDWDGFMTYVLLREKTDPKKLEEKLPPFVEKRASEIMKQYNMGMIFHLSPITKIHLYSNSNLMHDYGPNGNGKAVYFLAIVAVFILIIAWVNYINLSTARSLERAREVGVRKVMGSFRTQLISQFLFESFLIQLIAFTLAIGIVWILLPSFSSLSDRSIDLTIIRSIPFWLGASGMFLGGVILAGLYPAFVMSSFKPVLVLKGRMQTSARGIYLRRSLVVFQFLASITLIVSTFTVYRQLNFMRNSDLGFKMERTVIVNGPSVRDSTYVNRFEAFQNSLLRYPEIQNVSASTSVPGRQPGWNAGGIRRIGDGDDMAKQYRILGIDYDFVETFQLKLIAGRDFSRERKTDRSGVLFNESAMRAMGFKNPAEALDEKIFFWGDTFHIVGVLKNYHQESLKKDVEPLIFRCIPDANSYYSLRIKSNDIPSTVRLAEGKFKEVFPGNPFQYFFLDEYYNQQYQADRQFGKVFGIFATLAIFIACLGLFGLSSYTVVQRTKEIGVRKVLGASVVQVISLLFRDFAILVAMAIILAIPVSWWLMNNWLSEFANRITLSWWIFLVPIATVIFIAWATISVHTYKAASANPVESLRYE